jgi:protein-disulfide isomerase/uncharacterized membrane protein YphA (DoxX/SURF4 family)
VNWNSVRGWLGTVVRLVLGIVWIWAAIPKLHSPLTFIQAVRAYDATPEWLSQAIAYGLPVLEFCLGAVLILGIMVRIAAATSAALFVVFLIGLIQAAARGLQLSCGCFGGGGQTLQTQYTLDILRDVGLLILAGYLIVWSFTQLSIEQYLARHDHVEEPSAKRMRSDQGRRKYLAEVAAKQKAARDRTRYVHGSLALVIVLVAVIGIGVQHGRAKIDSGLSTVNASVQYGVAYGQNAAATVDVYEDFQCPHCREFEQQVGATLHKDVKANLAQVRYRPIAILDSAANDDYSTRAANAALCASDISVDFFVKYHDYLFGEDAAGNTIQPPESGPGRTDKQLISYADAAGLPKKNKVAFTTCVDSLQHRKLVQAMTEQASKRGVVGTPTVYVDGKKLTTLSLAALKQAIAAADAKGPKPSPSPKPPPSPAATPSGSAPAATVTIPPQPSQSAAPGATATP